MASLRELRELAGWTQQRAARASSLDRSVFSMIETGEAEASAAKVTKIRRTLLRAIAKRAVRIERVLADSGESRRSRNTCDRLGSARA